MKCRPLIIKIDDSDVPNILFDFQSHGYHYHYCRKQIVMRKEKITKV